MIDTTQALQAAKSRLAAFAKASPALMQGFGAVSRQANRPGRFSAAQKELIAVSIAVAKGCEDCILYHVDAARSHGAGEEDLLEAMDVAIEMGGGPALMYAAKALQAFRATG